jgi:hypothetical protein
MFAFMFIEENESIEIVDEQDEVQTYLKEHSSRTKLQQ